MLMKVFNKGQVVIPVEIRKWMGVSIGDMLNVMLDKKHKRLELRKLERLESDALAGSLSKYAKTKKMPARNIMHNALRKGILHEI